MTQDHKPEREDAGTTPDPGVLCRSFAGIRHARFHDRNTVYHVLLRTVQGRFLLRPDERMKLAILIAGVIGRAQELYRSVQLFADAWLSNHAHLLLQGPPEEIPSFVGFIEREVSRRWGAAIAWEGSMFQTYQSTALPTEESQRRAFRYILAQSAKENLVASPLRWPGAHCAKDLVRRLTRRGIWLDATGYGKALHRHRARKSSCRPPTRHDFERDSGVRFSKLPALADLSDSAYCAHVARLVSDIEQEAAVERRRIGRGVIGRRRVLRMSREARSPLPRPPWFERRRRMICWADQRARQTLEYLRRYWRFQRLFREASRRFLAAELDAPFPAGAFRPPSFVSSMHRPG